jgi:hypothetical protein
MRGTHTSSQARCGAAALTVAVAIALATEAPVAAGGGNWVFPARDRYEAGQTVTMIGYGQGVDAALRARGPFYAWLRVDQRVDDAASAAPWPGVQPGDLRLGRVLVEDLGRPVDGTSFGPDQRLSVAFDLPADLLPRAYEVLFCNEPCTDALSTFIAEPVHVGVDAEYDVVRDWPLDDPAIRWLEDDALLALPGGGEITAAEVRAGAALAPTPVPGHPPAIPSAPHSQSAAAPATATPSDLPAREAAGATEREPGPDGHANETGRDGGAAARWVAVEVALLVVGAAAALVWTSRRQRPDAPVLRAVAPSAGDVDADDDLAGSDAAPRETIRL